MINKILSWGVSVLWDGYIPFSRIWIARFAYGIIPVCAFLALCASSYAGNDGQKILHLLSKNYGNLAIALLTLILFIAPFVRIFPTFTLLRVIMSYRREMCVLTGWLAFFHAGGLMTVYGMFAPEAIATFFTPANAMLFTGMLALCGIALLAFTSNNISVRILGAWWRRLHLLAYPIFLFALIHQSVRRGWTDPAILGALLTFLCFIALKYIAYRGIIIKIPRPTISSPTHQ